MCETVAKLIAEQNVVGWFQGRMEFGPRALGARSILADARSPKMKSTINQKIKFRESFRPFAPIVLKEHVHQLFDVPPSFESPYMSLVAPVRMETHDDVSNAHPSPHVPTSTDARSAIPAATHIDHSARVQTVDAIRNPLLHNLLSQFHRLTECPALINTSFNVRSEPIVCTPEEAYNCFMMTEMDALVIGQHLLRKADQPSTDRSRQQHLAQFTLD